MNISPLMSGREAPSSFSVSHSAPTNAPGRKSTPSFITRHADPTHGWKVAWLCLTVLQSFTAQSDLNSRIFLPGGRCYQQNYSQEETHVAADVSSSPLKWSYSICRPNRVITFISQSSLHLLRLRTESSNQMTSLLHLFGESVKLLLN